MKLITSILATAVAVIGVANAQCSGTSLDLTEAPSLTCLCDSTYEGPTCGLRASGAGDYSQCSNYNDAVDKPKEVSVIQGMTTADALVNNATVEWTVTFPAGLGRKFTSFSIGSCGNGRNLANLVQTSEPDGVNVGCVDTIVFEMAVTDLRENCGFTYELATVSNVNYANYSSDIRFEYLEDTVVATNTVPRSGMVVIPTSILLRNRVTATTESVNVYSPFAIETALTAQAIDAGATSSILKLTYVLSEPYSVIRMNPVLENVEPTLNTAFLCDAVGGTCGADLNVDGRVFLTMPECKEADYVKANNGCMKEAIIQLVHGQCELDGTHKINDIVIDCYPDLDEKDCPLNEQSDGSTIIDFTLASENFCGGMGTPTLIDDAVNIDQFIFVDPENRQRGDGTWDAIDPVSLVSTTKPSADTPITALEHGQFAYARIDFSKLAVTAVTIFKSEIRNQGDAENVWIDTLSFPTATGAITAGSDYTITRGTTESATYESDLTCKTLGLCPEKQSFLVQYLIDESVSPKFANPGLGETTPFKVRLMIDVSYETNMAIASRRRRRRQATTGVDNQGPTQDGAGPASVSASSGIQGTDQVANSDEDNAAGTLPASTLVLLALSGLSVALAL